MSVKKAVVLIFIILLIDQASKIYVKMHFILGEDVTIFSWFKLYFVENTGMAWGTTLNDLLPFISDRVAKLTLTLFRICAITGIGFWLFKTIKNGHSKLLALALTFVFAGALGNILDSVFYGIFFNDSFGQVATFFPEEGGYDEFLHGKVVDMLYFPIYNSILPNWIPFFGGKTFSFFDPVFNVADVAISIGFALLVIFNKRLFVNEEVTK